MIEDLAPNSDAAEPQPFTAEDSTPETLAVENSVPLPDDSVPDPWLEAQAKHEQAVQDYQIRALGKVYSAAQNWDSATRGKFIDLGFDSDPETAKAEILTTAYLKALNRGQPVPGGDTGERLFMDQVDQQRFGGRVQGDPVRFAGEIRKEGEYVAGQTEIQQMIYREAANAAVVIAADPWGLRPDTYWNFLRKLQESPNYDDSKYADYIEEWNARQDETRAIVAPYREQLQKVMLAIGEDDVGAVAQDIYAQLTPEQRAGFVEAVGTAVQAEPDDKQAALLANMAKSIYRPVRPIYEATQKGPQVINRDSLRAQIDQLQGEIADPNGLGILDPRPPDKMRADLARLQARFDASQENLNALNFSQDLQDWQQRRDPIQKIGKNWATRGLESIAYSAPGLVEGIAPALIPGVGPAYLAASGTGSAYTHLRSTLIRQGASPELADQQAGNLAPVAGAVSTVGMLFGTQMLKGLPLVDKALSRIADSVGEGMLARGVTRAVGGGILDTATFRALDFVDPLVQAAAKSLGAPIPGVELHNATKTGVLDNFTGMTVETAASIVPLAIATAFRGFGADNRSRIFATASDLQMRALGYPEAEVAAIRAAQIKGTSALSSAIDAAAPQVNGATLEAAAARRELAARVEQAKQVAKSGILPKFVTTREGTTVIDPDTGKALGPPGTFEEARRLAAAHSSALDGMKGDEVRRLATVLEGPQRPQEIVGSPGEGEARQASAPDEKSPVGQRQPEPFADSQRVQARLAGEEIAAGGRGEVTRSVTGDSKAEFDQDVRRTVTEHLGGTPVQAIVQKVTQEKLADLWDSGAMTREQTVEALRALDRGEAGIEAGKNQANEALRLLPEIPDSELTDPQIQEAASRFMAGEILSPRQDPEAPGKLASRPVMTDKLRAAATALAPEATRKWTAFSKALRDHFGVAFNRALKIQDALKSGDLDPQTHADFVAKLLGPEGQGRSRDRGDGEGKNRAVGDIPQPKLATTDEGTIALHPETGEPLGPPGKREEAQRMAKAYGEKKSLESSKWTLDYLSQPRGGTTILDQIENTRKEGSKLVEEAAKSAGLDPAQLAGEAGGYSETRTFSNDPKAFRDQVVSLAKNIAQSGKGREATLRNHNREVVGFLRGKMGLPLETMAHWIRETERSTRRNYLPEGFDSMSPEDRLSNLGKAWQDITHRSTLGAEKGSIAAKEMPPTLRALIKQNALVTQLALTVDPGEVSRAEEGHARQAMATVREWKDQMLDLHSKFVRLLPGTRKSQYANHDSRFFDLTREERQIGSQKFELLLIYARGDGAYHVAVPGEEGEVIIPPQRALPAEGAIIIHNHPSGAGPSNSDIANALIYGNSIFRIIARQSDGSYDVYQIRATPEKLFPDWEGSQKDAWNAKVKELIWFHEEAAARSEQSRRGSQEALKAVGNASKGIIEIEWKNVR